jgi:chromosome segregation ATPase
MSKTIAKSKTATPKISPKDLQKKLDELTVTAEALKSENEKLRTNFKLICKKIVDNTDLSNYQFLDPNIEPDQIGINDLLHMLQTIALLAEKLNKPNDGIVNHVENLELRITELLSEQGSMFKNKLKLQERLEFIMQERDVWKRNAQTIKKMYEKLG